MAQQQPSGSFTTGFATQCECGQPLHGTITTTGLRYLGVSTDVDVATVDVSNARTSVQYEHGDAHCPKCGKDLPTKPEKQKGEHDMGGKPNPGTPADKRLKENKPAGKAAKPATPPAKPAIPTAPARKGTK